VGWGLAPAVSRREEDLDVVLVLVAGGYSLWLLALFYWMIDMRQWRGWCRPLVWIGMNAITLYLANTHLLRFRTVAQRIAGGDVKVFFDTHVTPDFGDVMIATTALALVIWLAWFLHASKNLPARVSGRGRRSVSCTAERRCRRPPSAALTRRLPAFRSAQPAPAAMAKKTADQWFAEYGESHQTPDQ